jgi:hypothetical protein
MVDKFKDDVRGRSVGLVIATARLQLNYKQNATSNEDNWQDIEPQALQQSASFSCVDRWRNAGPEQHKRMFSVFHESGIFIAACRHRFVLLACDMVKSGELYVTLFDEVTILTKPLVRNTHWQSLIAY